LFGCFCTCISVLDKSFQEVFVIYIVRHTYIFLI
jgi:hypothetical protein